MKSVPGHVNVVKVALWYDCVGGFSLACCHCLVTSPGTIRSTMFSQ